MWLVLVVVGGLAACAAPPPSPTSTSATAAPPRVLLIGLDGADWEIIDPLAAAGLLPNLARLRQEGAAGILSSEEPLLSPIVWTTIATGRGPLEHGIFGFLTRRGGATVPVGSNERRVRAFWNILGDVGLSAGVIGWYASGPAEPVTGYLISDQVASHQVSGSAAAATVGATWPVALAALVATEAQAAAVRAEPVVERLVTGPIPAGDEIGATLAGMVRTTELYRALVPRLNAEHRPTVSAVYFEGTDAVGHLVGAHAPPALPWVAVDEAQRYGGTLHRFYAYVDEVVGSLVAGLDPAETTVVIVSDHGFRVGDRRPLVASHQAYANRAAHWHRPEGVILLWGRGVRPGATIAATVYDVLPTVLRLAGAPLAATLEGRVLTDALAPGLPELAPVADYEARGPRPTAATADADWAGQVDKLRALGYVDDESTAAAVDSGVGEGQDGVAVNRYNRGRIFLAAGRSEEAAAEMRALQVVFPGSVLGWLGSGIVALDGGDAGAAAAALRRAVAVAPDMTLAWELLAQAALVAGDPAGAARAADAALARDPSSCRGLIVRGRVLLSTSQVAAAGPCFARANDTCGETSERVEAMVGSGIVAEADGDLARAASIYDRALALLPADPWALERAANLAVVRGDGATAVDLLARMVAATDRDPRALTLNGQALAAAGRGPPAAEALREALERDPQYLPARRVLAKVEAVRGGAPVSRP